MKYIKTFEENIFLEINKKYIIIASTRPDIPYYILNINKIENNILYFFNYYYMNDENLINTNINGRIQEKDIKHAISNLEYQTDNLEDAIEILKSIETFNKYNL